MPKLKKCISPETNNQATMPYKRFQENLNKH